MAEAENIIIKDTLDGLGTDTYSNNLAHALCLAGSCRLKYNGEERELLIASVQMLILDFFDFHSHLYGTDNIPLQSAAIMSRFLNMLENGAYREHREVSWYADKLCVTPKYLSEISRKISGYAANYWITRYTVLDISRLLRDKSLTFVRISDMFGFSSPAYFSRYVQQHLGVSPTEYRG